MENKEAAIKSPLQSAEMRFIIVPPSHEYAQNLMNDAIGDP